MGHGEIDELEARSRLESALARAAALINARPPALMKRLARYRLTWFYLILSSVIFVIVALTISAIAARSAESSVLTQIRDESTKDAQLIATVVSRAISNESGQASGELVDPAEAGSLVSEFLSASNIFRLALYDPSGRKIWVSNASEWGVSVEQERLLDRAMAGATASGLLRQQLVRNRPAEHKTLDVVETYIPFMTSSNLPPALVLGISRDVTETLAEQMGQIKSGMSRWILLTMGGGFVALLLFILAADITLMRTRERALEQERTVARQRLSIERLDIENRELGRSSSQRTKFVSMVSHELRTPLTSIVAFADILIKNGMLKEPAQTTRYLEIIKRNGLSLQTLVSDLLDVGKFQSSKLQIEPAQFSLPAMLAEVHDGMGVIFETKKQVVHFSVDGSASVWADRARLAQVIRNLLSNASKYSPTGSAIEVRAAIHDNVLAMSIRDHGAGMSKEDLKRLFTPFFRADNETTRSVPGTGLGLTIVKAIVEAHGGAISVESESGIGTVVEVRIPVRAVSFAAAPADVRESPEILPSDPTPHQGAVADRPRQERGRGRSLPDDQQEESARVLRLPENLKGGLPA
jgi:signal transduction histidine kinase